MELRGRVFPVTAAVMGPGGTSNTLALLYDATLVARNAVPAQTELTSPTILAVRTVAYNLQPSDHPPPQRTRYISILN
jgi:hypothetical protein